MNNAEHDIRHSLEHELWLKELGFLCGEIDIMKRHLGDVYYRAESPGVMEMVAGFDEKFRLHKEWLERMKNDLVNYDQEEVDPLIKKSFSLQMQANRIINEELKNSFLQLFS